MLRVLPDFFPVFVFWSLLRGGVWPTPLNTDWNHQTSYFFTIWINNPINENGKWFRSELLVQNLPSTWFWRLCVTRTSQRAVSHKTLQWWTGWCNSEIRWQPIVLSDYEVRVEFDHGLLFRKKLEYFPVLLSWGDIKTLILSSAKRGTREFDVHTLCYRVACRDQWPYECIAETSITPIVCPYNPPSHHNWQ